MHKVLFAAALSAVASVAAAQASHKDLPAAGPLAPDTPSSRAYSEAARALASADDNPMIQWAYRTWCVTGYRTVGEAGRGQSIDKPIDRNRDMLSPLGYIDPKDDRAMPAGGVRFMDNAWYFGTDVTGMVVVKTPDGLLMFDALTTPADMQKLGIDQMRAAGLDPSQILYIFLGHEHPDHIGGVNLILDRYAPQAKIVSSSPAAAAIQKMRDAIASGKPSPLARGHQQDLTDPATRERMLAAVPKRIDIKVDAFPGMKTGLQKIRVGPGIEVTAMLTPGHTLGQLTAIVPVTLHGKPEKLLVWSGNDSFERSDIYAASTDFIRMTALNEGANAFLNTHAYQGAAFYHLRKLASDSSALNPMAMGRDGVQRYLGVFAECQRAQDRRRRDGTWKAL